MSIHPIMQKLAAKLERTDLPEFAPGDTVRVQVEESAKAKKERLQAFEGMVIATRRAQGSFTVRKMSFGQGVERIFPFNSKVVDKVEKFARNQVRRSKLFYLRGLRGKAARLREVERTSSLSIPLSQSGPGYGCGFCSVRKAIHSSLEYRDGSPSRISRTGKPTGRRRRSSRCCVSLVCSDAPEQALRHGGFRVIAGVDEVGRGRCSGRSWPQR